MTTDTDRSRVPTNDTTTGNEPAPYTCKHGCERDGLMDTITAQAQELDRLRAALRHYGRHNPTCKLYANTVKYDCTCGLSAALKSKEQSNG